MPKMEEVLLLLILSGFGWRFQFVTEFTEKVQNHVAQKSVFLSHLQCIQCKLIRVQELLEIHMRQSNISNFPPLTHNLCKQHQYFFISKAVCFSKSGHKYLISKAHVPGINLKRAWSTQGQVPFVKTNQGHHHKQNIQLLFDYVIQITDSTDNIFLLTENNA